MVSIGTDGKDRLITRVVDPSLFANEKTGEGIDADFFMEKILPTMIDGEFAVTLDTASASA